MADKNDATTIIEGLEATRRALQHVDALAGILLKAEDAGGGFEDGIIGTNMSAIRTALMPTFEAIENAIIVLDGGKVPEPFEPGVTEPAVPPGQVSTVDTSAQSSDAITTAREPDPHAAAEELRSMLDVLLAAASSDHELFEHRLDRYAESMIEKANTVCRWFDRLAEFD